MNILLVYPEFPDTFWSFKHALRFIRKRASLPPLGLLTVAAMLPPGWGKRLVDVNVTKLRDKDLAWADYVFISAMTVQRDSAHQIVSRCKQAGVKTVAGGPVFVSEHEQFEDVDHFVLNEAEITLPLFLADLERGQAERIYTTSEFPDIQKTPAPLWDLVDLKRYASMCIQFSRGCPFNCDFCNVTALLGHKPRTKAAEQIVAELDGLYGLGWRGQVFFVDDNFIGNKRVLKTELLPAILEWQRNKDGIPFNTEVSINLADDEELMQLMVEAGFDTVFVGIETPDEDSLAECSKKQNKNRDLVEDVKRIQRAGLQVQGGFIVGFDSDTPLIFQRQIDFIQKSGIVTAMVGLLQAIPGTRLYERLKREGRLREEGPTGDNVDGTTNIISRMNLDTLRDGYKRIMEQIYSPKQYYERVRTFLREYKPPKIKPPLDRQRVLAFFRSIVRLGILGRERFHYWKLLLWTLFHRPRLFPEAVTFAIYGYHFRKVCELRLVDERAVLARHARRRRR
ncbi:MAG: B12-binding domain-containing radical SAM protein [Anaerolineae bacterium]|nr:B12-binding domain-containing radical SAM protein [Anaerolineae bacterium]